MWSSSWQADPELAARGVRREGARVVARRVLARVSASESASRALIGVGVRVDRPHAAVRRVAQDRRARGRARGWERRHHGHDARAAGDHAGRVAHLHAGAVVAGLRIAALRQRRRAPGSARRAVAEVEAVLQRVAVRITGLRGKVDHRTGRGRVGRRAEGADHRRPVAADAEAGRKGEGVGRHRIAGGIADAVQAHFIALVGRQWRIRLKGEYIVEGVRPAAGEWRARSCRGR
jgi:hypothetical protein